MKIQCYGKEVLNEENRKVLMEKNKYAKSVSYEKLRKLIKPFFLLTVIILVTIRFVKDPVMELLLMFILLILMLILAVLNMVTRYNKILDYEKFKNFDELYFPNLLKEIIYVDSKYDREELYSGGERGIMNAIKNYIFTLTDLFNSSKKFYVRKNDGSLIGGKLLYRNIYANDNYVMLELYVKQNINRIKYFAIVQKEHLDIINRMREKDN